MNALRFRRFALWACVLLILPVVPGPCRGKAPDDGERATVLEELADLTARVPGVKLLRISQATAEPLTPTAKSRYTTRLTLKGTLPDSDEGRRTLDQLVAAFLREGRYTPEPPKMVGKEFTLVVNVEPRPAADAKVPAADAADQQIFRLKYIAATDASQVLRELLGDEIGPKAAIHLAVDERTNALVASGSAANLARVATLLNKIDIAGDVKDGGAAEVKVFPLNRAEPDLAEQALGLLFDGRPSGKFVVDRGRRVVLAYGAPTTLAAVEKTLTVLDIMSEGKADPIPLELQVCVTWLINGTGKDDGPGLPDDLKETAAELAKLGLDKPRLAARLSVGAVLDAPFEISGVAQLDAAYRLSASGTVAQKKDAVGLEITVGAERASGRRPDRVASLHTQVTVAPGRPVVLGVTPTEAQISAFVVQVVSKKPSVLPGKPAAFEFQDAPWKTVFEWLADRTGMPVICSVKPPGTFTFMPPKSDKKYTTPEIIDILNEALLEKNYLLIRRTDSFLIAPADEQIDFNGFFPRVLPGDLEKHGKSEMVSIAIPLDSLSAEEIAPDIKKMVGPFGGVEVQKSGNQLIVKDAVGNLQRIWELVKDLEKKKGK